ncbi:ISNCY family transposase [[Eubacterium] hominis]|uniref:ISNCY family transposase n=1 Tax=[Eubacterium] hominis TaxID=2764325 RepID=A0A7G9GIZ1_9FIRM|nr:ISNCY family transposase [[Eubacterium] hominis]
MRKVNFRMNEQYKYEVIKKLVDTHGNKKNAAIKLNCSVRTIDRLIIRYKAEGKTGFIHKNRNRQPISAFPVEVKNKVIDLYRTKYSGANLLHFSQLLAKKENIHVSDTTINYWLRSCDILSPKARRKTVNTLNAELRKRKKAAKTKKEAVSIENKLDLLDRFDAHPRRPRCAYFGELVQMDASPHLWFGTSITHLHLAIDDATGKILGAYFDTQETLNAYYQITHQILIDYGIPAKFLTDRRTVFEYKRKNASSDEEDTFTQFSYACHQLGIELECTSVPQAKGRVERLNQTLQSRLVIELRLAGITTIEEANEFLKSYLKEFNAMFSLPINDTKTVFEKQPSKQKINQTLAILSNRKLDSGHCIRYKNKYFIPITKSGSKAYLKKGMNVMVIEAFDGKL